MPKTERIPPRRLLMLAFTVEVEIAPDDDDSIITQAVIDDIEGQVSGQLREIRVNRPGGWTHVDYQVNAMHGWKD